VKDGLPKKIDIIDTTLRDGFQHEEQYIPLEAKQYVFNRLLESGFKRIEVGTLSHVAYVPQFKDVDDFILSLPANNDMEYTILALNKKAVERAIALIRKGAKIDRVLTGQIATSEAYAKKNMNRTHEELFQDAEINVQMLHKAGVKKVVGNIGTIFGCPIQGKVPIERAYEFTERMFNMGFDEIEHSDPDGNATPLDIENYFSAVMSKYPDTKKHSFHVHDIRGTGIACYYAAMLKGVTVFDCTLGGIGGQVANIVDHIPVKGIGEYYFDSRRTGLVSTEDFVTMVNEMNIETGIDHKMLYQLGLMLEKILGRQLHSFTSSIRYIKETQE
jgi:hydroxymethylglutaryl-CoA lyase